MANKKKIKTVVHLPTKQLFDKFFSETIFEKPETCGCNLDKWKAYKEETCFDIEGKRLGNKRFFEAKRDKVHYQVLNYDVAMDLIDHLENTHVKQILVIDAVEQSTN